MPPRAHTSPPHSPGCEGDNHALQGPLHEHSSPARHQGAFPASTSPPHAGSQEGTAREGPPSTPSQPTQQEATGATNSRSNSSFLPALFDYSAANMLMNFLHLSAGPWSITHHLPACLAMKCFLLSFPASVSDGSLEATAQHKAQKAHVYLALWLGKFSW